MASSLILPQSKGSTVDVSIIHGGRTTVPTSYVFQRKIPGHNVLDIPCYSFLIENKKQGKKVLFDLGIMKAWKEKQPPAILGQIEFANAVMDIEKDVAQQLIEAKVPLQSVNAIIWSHHHIDHTGDPSLFPASTTLVVGPGFKSNKTTFPGYPENSDAVVANDAFVGRELIELDFSSDLIICGFPAVDYFGDGSFYILQAQGHTHDHISALARTSDDKFVFLAGDVAHHPGEYRPTAHLRLPEIIQPSPFAAIHTPSSSSSSSCLGAIFEECHPAKEEAGKDYRTTPFYELNPAMNASLTDAIETVNKMEAFDASPNVFVVIAHDLSLLDVLPFFPETISNWDSANYKSIGTWRFLRDFGAAIKLQKNYNTVSK